MNRLKSKTEPKKNNDYNNKNNLSPPPSPLLVSPGPDPFIPPPPPPPPPPPQPFQTPPSVFNSFQPAPPRSYNSFRNFHISAHFSSANFGNREQGLSLTREEEKEKVVQDSVQKKLEEAIY